MMSYVWKDNQMVPGRHIEVQDCNDYGHDIGTFISFQGILG